ncbi:MAG: IS1595 family transposase, partial [Rikenellaceae bacterium]
GYLDEYHYRCNRRSHTEGIFDNLIKRMVENAPKRLGDSL